MGLKLPERVSAITLDADDRPVAYMPFGFISFQEHQLGNGDYFGLYWPIGREGEEPIVAETFHDEGSLMPAFSSLETFLGTGPELEEWEHLEFSSYEEDRLSPLASYMEAQRLLQNQDVEDAIVLLEATVRRLPEYTKVSALLATQYLRLGGSDDACRMAAQVIISPPSFGTAHWRKQQELSKLLPDGPRFLA